MALASAAIAVGTVGVAPAHAHRLDEYLEATTILVGRDRIAAQLRLTPGVLVAPAVLALIDANGDGVLSPAEQRAYAARVLGDVVLKVDGRRLPLGLVGFVFPDVARMRDGMGEIVVEFDAPVPAGGPERRLTFLNHHQPRIGVYLVNALVPRDTAIRITGQQRDSLQTRYELDYAQAAPTSAGVTAGGAAAWGPLSPAWWAGPRGWAGAVALLPLAWLAARRGRRVRTAGAG